MHSFRLAACLLSFASLGACGLGETAAVATLAAEQAEQLQQQAEQLKQQIDQSNTLSQQRLQKQLESQQ